MIMPRKSIENLHPYIPGKPIDDVKKQYGLKDVVKLASNENPYGASKNAVESFNNSAENIFLYPDGSCNDLRTALSKQLNVNENEIVIGAGADELISLIAQAYIETGDEMITAETTFGQYAHAVTAMGGNTIFTPMKEFGFNLNSILNALSDKTKLIFIANPNNPTGTLISDDEKKSFIEKVPKGVLVVFDEAYEEYVESSRFTSSVPLVKQYENLAVLKTFSKIYGLAGLRVGYGVMSSHCASYIEKIRKPFNVSIPAQMAALASLSDEQFLAMTKKENIYVKHFCYKKLDDLAIKYIKSETNFIPIILQKDSGDVFLELMKKGFIVRPVKVSGVSNCIRVTIGTMAQMDNFFVALSEVL